MLGNREDGGGVVRSAIPARDLGAGHGAIFGAAGGGRGWEPRGNRAGLGSFAGRGGAGTEGGGFKRWGIILRRRRHSLMYNKGKRYVVGWYKSKKMPQVQK